MPIKFEDLLILGALQALMLIIGGNPFLVPIAFIIGYMIGMVGKGN